MSGTAPKTENSKAAAQRAEAQQLAFMASRPKPADGATEEPPNTRNAPATEPSSEASRPAVAKTIPTLTAFAETFLAVTKPDNKPCTVENKESMLRLQILPRIGDLRVCDIDDAVIQDFRAALQNSPNL
ncbi:MAG: N-terminal phage integrase SAM-like domain-containing protein, partial [bacterium]